ncbi:MAG: NUDIX domain-containing protein [Thermodesulfobacteriota bacterium]
MAGHGHPSINFRTLFCFTWLSIFTMSSSAVCAASGMLLIAEENQINYVLLIRDRHDKHFELPAGQNEKAGSLLDPKRVKESDYETALRETVEETRGYLGRQQLINASQPIRQIHDGGFVLFLAKVRIFDLDEVRRIRIPEGNEKQWDPMRETIDLAWVDIEQIRKSTDQKVIDRESRSIRIHKLLPRDIQSAINLGWFQ